MAVERELDSIRTVLDALQDGGLASEHCQRLILEKDRLVHQLENSRITPGDLRERIRVADLTIKALQAREIVRSVWERVPGKLQIPFRDTNEPEILLKVAPFARRVEILIQQNRNRPYGNFMDVIDAINIIELIDTFTGFAKILKNTQMRTLIAGVLPKMIRDNLANFTGEKKTLLSTVSSVDVHKLKYALDRVNLVKLQLERLPVGTRLLLAGVSQGDCETELSETIRNTVLDLVWEKSFESTKPTPTSSQHLIRACLQVIMMFDLERSNSDTYAELLGAILSQPGMLDTSFSTEARTNSIRTHFKRCVYADCFDADQSFDAIVAYAEHHEGASYRELWPITWRRAISITYVMGMRADVMWGISPFERVC